MTTNQNRKSNQILLNSLNGLKTYWVLVAALYVLLIFAFISLRIVAFVRSTMMAYFRILGFNNTPIADKN